MSLFTKRYYGYTVTMHYVPIHFCKYQYYEINIIKWNLKENCYWNITFKEVILEEENFMKLAKYFVQFLSKKSWKINVTKIQKSNCRQNLKLEKTASEENFLKNVFFCLLRNNNFAYCDLISSSLDGDRLQTFWII